LLNSRGAALDFVADRPVDVGQRHAFVENQAVQQCLVARIGALLC
jgi:hypothetical protein